VTKAQQKQPETTASKTPRILVVGANDLLVINERTALRRKPIICSKYQRMGQYAEVCRSKSIDLVTSEDTDDILYLETLTTTGSHATLEGDAVC
jgi:hypothetical protein